MVKFYNKNGELLKQIEAKSGDLLIDLARAAGISVESPCGGKGVCGKCAAKILRGSVDFMRENHKNLPDNQVLLCAAKINSDDFEKDVEIEILKEFKDERINFVNFFDDNDDENINENEIFEPFVKKLDLNLNVPEENQSDFERLEKFLKKKLSLISDDEFNFGELKIELNALKKLPEAIRKENASIFYEICENNIVNIIDICNNYENYGLAIDIGTTTVSIKIVDLNYDKNINKMKIIGGATDYNSQIECGADVITRINFAKKNLSLLQNKILQTVNNLISLVCRDKCINSEYIRAVSIAGNTVMMHLFLGICPEFIRIEPYTPAIYKLQKYNAAELGIVAINKCAKIKFAPCAGSWLGGDICAGALCTSLADSNSEDVILFFDAGTNGEILLGNGEFILGCAASAGPAFEGGGISCGMRASNGAIDKIEINDFNINLRIVDEKNNTENKLKRYIEDSDILGICGTGIISAISEFFKNKIIDAAGKFCENVNFLEHFDFEAKPKRFYLDKAKKIFINEADIDNLIRAKAAIFAGCRTLLNKAGLNFSDVSKIYIAGGFGKYLNLDDCAKIGLLPEISPDKLIYVGNASLNGAYKTLVSKSARKKEQEIINRITYVDLSLEPDFMQEYSAALFLPHTDLIAGNFSN